MPRPGVPADHLRAGVHRPAEPGAVALPRPGRQAIARAAGVRFRPRGAGSFRPPRAPSPGARVRVRRAGAGKRAGRPAAVEATMIRTRHNSAAALCAGVALVTMVAAGAGRAEELIVRPQARVQTEPV